MKAFSQTVAEVDEIARESTAIGRPAHAHTHACAHSHMHKGERERMKNEKWRKE